MSKMRFLWKCVVPVPWRLLQITFTIITITEALLANVEHKIVLNIRVWTVGKLHLMFQLMASIERGQMAGFRDWVHSVEMAVDVDKV
jgi:hypothetical protein